MGTMEVRRSIEDLPQVPGGPERRRKNVRGCHAVSKHPDGQPFIVYICIQGTTYNLGYTATQVEGLERYRRAFKFVYGEEPWEEGKHLRKPRVRKLSKGEQLDLEQAIAQACPPLS